VRSQDEQRGGSIVRGRSQSIDSLADMHLATGNSGVRGDHTAVRAALDSAARLYGTSAPKLVDAVRQVAPPEIGSSLGMLCY